MKWPGGKRFAFTIFDDTDHTTIHNGPPIYQLLSELGIRTTKSVWPIQGDDIPRIGGATCQDPDYLDWTRRLQEQGFEIALHNVTYHSSRREQILMGLEHFKGCFGTYPNIHVNHTGCLDSLYWGDARLSGINRLLYNILTRFKNRGRFLGHLESSEYFWGDRCRRDIKYVRNFVYPEINTLAACPWMPYFDEKRPFVNYWFASSEGATCESFCRTISEENQDRLEEENGACIMYTHFGAKDFHQNGGPGPRFRQLMERLSRKPGWFVPVSTLLDYILENRGHHVLSAAERNRLERKWLGNKVFIARGTS
jgi:hypothetical protein